MTLDEIKRFRQLGSQDAGPSGAHARAERRRDDDRARSVRASATRSAWPCRAKMAEARFNTAEHAIFDHHIVCLAGDGCMQEGVALEAVEFAGHQQARQPDPHLRLQRRDARRDGQGDAERGHRQALRGARLRRADRRRPRHGRVPRRVRRAPSRRGSGKPQLIIAKTLIGKGIPEVAGTQKAHGEGGAKFVDAARKGLGLPGRALLRVRRGARLLRRAREGARRRVRGVEEDVRRVEGEEPRARRGARRARAPTRTPLSADTKREDARRADAARRDSGVPGRHQDRDAQGRAGRAAAARRAKIRCSIGGSADLYGSTLNYIGDLKTGNDDFKPGHRTGRNIRFGIREHGMCAIMNGIAAHGIFRPSGATFLVFADYCRAAIRLAALSHLPVIYIFTHDSVGVGEDGPTHQPVETVPGLRVIPNLDVIRPADPEETAGAFVAALDRTDGPDAARAHAPGRAAARARSRSRLRREGVLKGGYIAKKETRAARAHPALGGQRAAARARRPPKRSAPGTRVVSMPCFSRFDRQPAAVPRRGAARRACRKRVAIEATRAAAPGRATSASTAPSSASTASVSRRRAARS